MGKKKNLDHRPPVQSHKKPFAHTPISEKKPRYGRVTAEEYPSWHFSSMDWTGPFGWDEVSREAMKSMIAVICSFERNTWKQLMAEGGRKKHHFMPVNEICRKAQDRLTEINQDDIDDQLFSFRIMQKKRLWGIVDRHVFKILWWDPEHEVYPMDITDNSYRP